MPILNLVPILRLTNLDQKVFGVILQSHLGIAFATIEQYQHCQKLALLISGLVLKLPNIEILRCQDPQSTTAIASLVQAKDCLSLPSFSQALAAVHDSTLQPIKYRLEKTIKFSQSKSFKTQF